MPYRQPAYRILVDGQDITPTIRPRLESLRLTDNRGLEADTLDITLDDTDGALALPPRGARVRLALGWVGQPLVDKGDYLLAMERSPIKDVEIKVLLKAALSDEINSRDVYLSGIDQSYYYEGYTTFKAEDLSKE